MGVLGAFLGDKGELNGSVLCQRLQQLIIAVPAVHAVVINFVRILQLRPQVGGVQVAGQVAGAVVHPGVLVDLTPDELAAVGALFPVNFRLLHLLRVIDQHSAALTHGVVLGLMEAVAAHVTDGAQSPALIPAHHALRGILHHFQVVAPGDLHDGIHLAGYACIVNHADDGGLVGNGGLDFGLVDVHGVRADVHIDDLCAPLDKGVRSGDKGVGGQNHFIARLYIAQQSSHFQRTGAGGGQQNLGCAGLFLKPFVALFGEGAVAANLFVGNGLGQTLRLTARGRRHIKGNIHGKFLLNQYVL